MKTYQTITLCHKMDSSSNLIQILLFIQFLPLKDTFSNPSLKARIVMPSQAAAPSVMWMGPNWEAPVLSEFPPRLCDKSELQVTDWDYQGMGHHYWLEPHLPPLSPELRATIQICPLLHSPPAPILRSDPNNCRIYYTKLEENWKAAKHSACSTTCSCSVHDFS